MISILLTLPALIMAQSERIFSPQTQIYQETIPHTEYKSPMNKKEILSYDAYPGAFGYQLFELVYKNGTTIKIDDALSNGDYERTEVTQVTQRGCYAYQKHISFDEDLKINLRLGSNDSVYYVDVAAVPHSNKAILLRNDFTVFEVDVSGSTDIEYIQEQTQSRTFKDVLGVNQKVLSEPGRSGYLVEDKQNKIMFAITEHGGVSFPLDIDFTSEKFTFKKEDFKARNIIYDVHYNRLRKAIFVACGHDGVDVYKIENGSVRYVSNIDSTLMLFDDGVINIVDIDSDNTMDYLYILDFERGLMGVNIQNLDKIFAVELWVQISRAHQFDHEGETFIIVAETMSMEDYAVEVFINFVDNTYYFNRFYMDDMAIFDVYMWNNFAVLVGDDAHRVIFHSVYSGFINENVEGSTFFHEQGLLKLEQMVFTITPWRAEIRMVGLSQNEFKFFEMRVHHPSVECKSSSLVQKHFELIMNSTSCNIKKEKNDTSHYNICQINHRFTFETYDPQSLEDKFKKYAEIIYVLLFLITWTVVIMYVCYRRWHRIISYLSWKQDKLKKKSEYDNFVDGPAQNLDQSVSKSLEMSMVVDKRDDN